MMARAWAADSAPARRPAATSGQVSSAAARRASLRVLAGSARVAWASQDAASRAPDSSPTSPETARMRRRSSVSRFSTALSATSASRFSGAVR